MVTTRIPVGVSNGRKVYLDPERRSWHMHVVGGSGQGKSKFLEHIIREDILAGHGLCLLDPHGELCDNILRWSAVHGVDKFRKIHVVDPRQGDYRFCFNPLRVADDENELDRVDNIIEALAQVWGGEDSRTQPAIRTTLRAILTALISHGLTLAEAFSLTSFIDQNDERAFLTTKVQNDAVRKTLEGYTEMEKRAPRELVIEFGGMRRRFLELLNDTALCQTLGNVSHAIDFRACMDHQEVVLVNLSDKGYGPERARVMGALLVREMFFTAKRRDENYAKEHPFYLYVDECAEFLTRDIAKLLAQTRKYGLHAILAHQWLGQLKEADAAIYDALMAIQNKVIFGGLQDQDAAFLADELFRTEYDLEVPVAELVKPTVVGYGRTWLQNWSSGEVEGTVESVGSFEVTGLSSGLSSGTVQQYDENGFPVGGVTATSGESSSESSMSGTSQGTATVSMRTSSQGASEALEPILEDRPTAVHSLENVKHMAVRRLRSLPPRNAVVKGGQDQPSFDIHTFAVDEPPCAESVLQSFTKRLMNASPYTVPAVEASDELELRTIELQKDIDFWRAPHKFEPEEDEDAFLG